MTYIYLSPECCLNLHEDERQKPENWIPVAWFPIYDEEKSNRPGKGYKSDSARSMRLYHDCWRHVLRTWEAKTKNTQLVVYPDQITRQTRFFIGGLLGDQQVLHFVYIMAYYVVLIHMMTYFRRQTNSLRNLLLHAIVAMSKRANSVPVA